MIYNAIFDVAISADRGGMMEYWRGLKGGLEFFSTLIKNQKKSSIL